MNEILQGDALATLKTLPDKKFQTCVTSPPYWGLRDYGVEGQLGLESTPEEYVANMVNVFREVRRVLRDDGTLWLNLGDSYFPHGGSRGNKNPAGDTLRGRDNEYQPAPKFHTVLGLKGKDLVGIPWRVAFALQADGWYLRSDIIWHKPNPMPESVTDRPTKSHEYIFLFSKSKNYYYNHEAIKEKVLTRDNTNRDRDTTRLNNTPGISRMAGLKTNDYETKNKRTVWTVSTKPFKEAHFATFPPDLIEPCILAGSKEGDEAVDPFFGSGTVGEVSLENNRDFTGIELNPDYIKIAKKRLENVQPKMMI